MFQKLYCIGYPGLNRIRIQYGELGSGLQEQCVNETSHGSLAAAAKT
jgi:hypothetical protein